MRITPTIKKIQMIVAAIWSTGTRPKIHKMRRMIPMMRSMLMLPPFPALSGV
jgi:hypothetical protein